MFIDEATITVESGRGGPGCVSTLRQKFRPKGGPDGGNGGDGGSVWFIADPKLTTLLDFRYRRHYRAGNGKPGEGRNRTGAGGEDLLIPVPCGTALFRSDTAELLADMVEPGVRFKAAAGGRGGKGNYELRSARNQTPLYAQKGMPNQSLEIRLELKLLADIGLVGPPNAGKSTLLSVLSAARPKVADYPFTTLVPNLGIVDLGEFVSATVADLPGLIEGASEGKGLGLEFLRHVERTRMLVMLLDITGEEPLVELASLRQELVRYGHRLPDLPFAVALTKSDLTDPESIARTVAVVAERTVAIGGKACVPISSVTHQGLTELRHLLRRMYLDCLATEENDDPGSGPGHPPR